MITVLFSKTYEKYNTRNTPKHTLKRGLQVERPILQNLWPFIRYNWPISCLLTISGILRLFSIRKKIFFSVLFEKWRHFSNAQLKSNNGKTSFSTVLLRNQPGMNRNWSHSKKNTQRTTQNTLLFMFTLSLFFHSKQHTKYCRLLSSLLTWKHEWRNDGRRRKLPLQRHIQVFLMMFQCFVEILQFHKRVANAGMDICKHFCLVRQVSNVCLLYRLQQQLSQLQTVLSISIS